MKHFELEPANAHPNAQKILTDNFYWDPINETAPFGSDDGSDAFQHFFNWRNDNRNISPVIFLAQLIDEWGYEKFDLTVIGNQNVEDLLEEIDPRMLIGQDNAVIAVGFGQFVLEGQIDNDIKDLTKKAISRELTDELLSEFPESYRGMRKEYLKRMLTILDKM